MRVIPIPYFGDNYCYAVYVEGGDTVQLVDAADWGAVKSFIQGHPVLSTLRLTHVLTTHKHMDHSRDNPQIKAENPEIQVVGGAPDNVPACTMPVQQDSSFTLDGGLQVHILRT